MEFIKTIGGWVLKTNTGMKTGDFWDTPTTNVATKVVFIEADPPEIGHPNVSRTFCSHY